MTTLSALAEALLDFCTPHRIAGPSRAVQSSAAAMVLLARQAVLSFLHCPCQLLLKISLLKAESTGRQSLASTAMQEAP